MGSRHGEVVGQRGSRMIFFLQWIFFDTDFIVAFSYSHSMRVHLDFTVRFSLYSFWIYPSVMLVKQNYFFLKHGVH